MAELLHEFNADQKLEALKMEIIQTFEELYNFLSEHRLSLLTRLDKMKEGYDKNISLDEAIKQLRISRDNLTSNLLAPMRNVFDDQMEGFENSKVAVEEDLELVSYRCYSDKIHNAIKEIDLFQLIPEYVRRETPILKVCKRGRENGELNNPKGISVDLTRNEVYVCDLGNSRIQVFNIEGMHLRSFGTGQLYEPRSICLSQDEVFITDGAKQSVLKFTLAGQLLKATGSRGDAAGQFKSISGLCYDNGLIYVCDSNVQRIQIFDSNLSFIKIFGKGIIKLPTDIRIYSDTIFILSQSNNAIHCYCRDCTFQENILLTGQEQQMTLALYFTIDKKGNFLISDIFSHEIRIFTTKGLLKHILGRGHLQFLCGLALENTNGILCVCNCIEGLGYFQKY